MQLIKKFVKSNLSNRVVLYRDEKLYTYEGESELKILNQFSILLVSNQYLIEVKKFFNLTKSSELKTAANIFAEQKKPGTKFNFFISQRKTQNGCFITVSYIESSLFEKLQLTIQKGGLILPEAHFVSAIQNDNIIQLQTGQYVKDVNYGAVFNFGKTLNIFSFENQAVEISNRDFYKQLTRKIEAKDLYQFINNIKFAKTKSIRLTFGNIAVFLTSLFCYFALSSLYLNYRHATTQNTLEENKKLIASFKAQEKKITELVEQKTQLEQPFLAQKKVYKFLSVLNGMNGNFVLENVVIRNSLATIKGSAEDANVLFKYLSEHPEITGVSYKSPVKRRGELDRFTIEYGLK